MRKQEGFTQKEVADAAGMNVRFYQRLEGGVENLELVSVFRIAAVFGCEFKELL